MSDLVDKAQQLFGGRPVLFKQTQECLDQLIECNAGSGWVLDLLDQGEQRDGQRGGGFDVELDSVFSVERRSEHLFKTVDLTTKCATLQFLGRTEAAQSARREFVANNNADLEAAKECIARVKNRFQQGRRTANSSTK